MVVVTTRLLMHPPYATLECRAVASSRWCKRCVGGHLAKKRDCQRSPTPSPTWIAAAAASISSQYATALATLSADVFDVTEPLPNRVASVAPPATDAKRHRRSSQSQPAKKTRVAPRDRC